MYEIELTNKHLKEFQDKIAKEQDEQTLKLKSYTNVSDN
jgi:hypothetical protein